MKDEVSIKCVAVTAQEWLLWIELGVLRCASRIVELQNPLVPGDLERLLSRAPDFQLNGDGALVIALLLEGEVSGVGEDSLDLGSVAEFIPLTENGAKILSRDAKSAGVQFGAPRFEEHFQRWRRAIRLGFSHAHGMRFVDAAGFQPLASPADQLHALADSVTRKPKTFPKIERKRNRIYFGWAIALTQLSERMPANRWRDIRRRLAVEEFLKSLVDRPASRAPVAVEPDVRRFARSLRAACTEAGIADCRVMRDSVVAHWADFLEMSSGSGLEDERPLRALGSDLRAVEVDEGEESAAIAAYCIARSMRAETISHLFYARRPSDFPCLRLSAPQNWMGEPAIPIDELADLPQEPTSADTAAPSEAAGPVPAPPSDPAAVVDPEQPPQLGREGADELMRVCAEAAPVVTEAQNPSVAQDPPTTLFPDAEQSGSVQ